VTSNEARPADDVPDARRELEHRTRELARSEARFRDVIERNADAIVVVDEGGVVRLANTAATKLFGTPREKLLGSSFGFPLVTGETTELDLRSGGEQRVAEMRVVESEFEGRPACIASLRDVTDRKRAERDARELIREHAARTAAEDVARRLRFLLDSSTLLAASLDYTATLSALAGLCVKEIGDWAVIYCLDDQGALQRLEIAHRDPAKMSVARELQRAALDRRAAGPVLDVLNTGQSVLVRTIAEGALEWLMQTAQPQELVRELGAASFMIVPIIARGVALGAMMLVSADETRPFSDEDLALAEDIAARAALAVANARLYETAQQANKTKLDFLAVLSHDLRTPLTAITGYVDLMAMGIPDPLPDGTRERLQRIRAAAAHQLYLMNELLTFARLDAGRQEVRLREVDLRDIVREAIAVTEPQAVERGLELRLVLPDDPLVLRTDPDKVRQLLLNLAGNAVKYTERGDVTVELSRAESGAAVIRVRDSGVGIASDDLKQIFEPFWQVASRRRRVDGGAGLGLSVVRRIVSMLGGDISVESVLGRGSTFTVTLPAT
jgi:signal transduction histidine kinase